MLVWLKSYLIEFHFYLYCLTGLYGLEQQIQLEQDYQILLEMFIHSQTMSSGFLFSHITSHRDRGEIVCDVDRRWCGHCWLGTHLATVCAGVPSLGHWAAGLSACQNLFSPLTTTTYLHHTPHTYAASIRNTEENLSEFIQLTANKRSVNEYSNLLQLTDWCTQALSQLITRILLSVVLCTLKDKSHSEWKKYV